MRSRDGSQIICVDCDAKPPAAVQKKAEKQHETAPSQDYSSHLELLEQTTFLIFKKMSLWEDTFAYNVATDALASLAAVSGGKVSFLRVPLFVRIFIPVVGFQSLH